MSTETGRFGRQENDFRREKAISNETREPLTDYVSTLARIESVFVFESSFTARHHLRKENMYYDFL